VTSLYRTTASLVIFGSSHAAVDAVSAGTVLALWQSAALTPENATSLFLLYNGLAFGTQPLIGWLVDASRRPRAAALLGVALTALAAGTGAFIWPPWLVVILVGLGNALFHLGAGSLSLRLAPGRAAAPGVFVAPGAVGLFAGTVLGRDGAFAAWPFLVGLACLGVAMLALRAPSAAEIRVGPPAGNLATLALVLACVAARSLVGFAVETPWKSTTSLAACAVACVALGKAGGGVMADRWGFGRVAVAGLALAAPLLAFGGSGAAAALAGLFLLNLSMPVTLVAAAHLLPNRPAFAFGLTCLALEVGAWPMTQWSGDATALGHPWVVFACCAGAAGALYSSLRRVRIDG
jgi:MFS transporter, FSR family, fosmidomycin resistance protein